MTDRYIDIGTTLLGKSFYLAITILLLSCLCPMALQAQQYLATVSGAVTDPSGANIPGADVTLTEANTHFVTKGVTNQSGSYSIPFVAPGSYSVQISAPGFAREERGNVVVSASAKVEVDFKLKLGSETQQVIVSADREVLDTGDANLGTVLDAKEVSDTPNIGRNPFNLATLAPGVYSAAYMQSHASTNTRPNDSSSVQLTVNGNYGHQRLTLNGIPDDPPEKFSGVDDVGFVPSPEAVQEVKVQTALYDAQFGHGNGTVVNTVLKTGANQYHGSLYYVFQNTYINANLYDRNAAHLARANDQWAQPGLVLNGPLSIPRLYNGHDKTFFSIAYEQLLLHTPTFYTSTVPSNSGGTTGKGELGGDFSGLVQANGKPIIIYDPLSQDTSPGAKPGDRLPFAGNIIPANRVSASGAALLSYYPQPNTTPNAQGLNNYVARDVSSPDNYWSLTAHIDHEFSAAHKINATYLKSERHQTFTKEGFPFIGRNGSGYVFSRNDEGGSLEYVTVVSPTLVVDARVGGIYKPLAATYNGYPFDLSKIGINATGLPVQSFPGTTMSEGYSNLQSGVASQYSESVIGTSSLLVSKSLQKHSLRFGLEAQVLRYNVSSPTTGLSSFTFNRQFTQKNSLSTAVGADPASGDPFAAALLGFPSGGGYNIQISNALQQLYYATYVQDDWRVNKNLTLNLGLRWDYEVPLTERYNRQDAGFCFTCSSPLQVSGLTLNGGLQFAGPNHRYPFVRDLNNFQPRFGITYQLAPRMVIRGGFGVTYIDTIDTAGTTGFTAGTSFVASIDGSTPVNTLANPFPSGIVQPSGSSLGLATAIGQSISFSNPSRVVPKIYQYSVNLQTQLPGDFVLEVGFVGSAGRELEVGKSINALPAQYYNQGAAGVTYLQQLVPNPFAGLLPGSSLNARTVQRQSLLTPYPQFTGLTENNVNAGSSLYTSMQDRVTKRLGHGLTLHANFTWAKVMNQDIYLNPQDSFDKTYRYENSQPNLIFSFVGSYHFPALNMLPKYARLLLGGWQVNAVERAQNGLLVANPSGVTVLGNPKLVNPTRTRFFNTCYLDTAGVRHNCQPGDSPAFQQNLAFTLNSAPPSMHNVRQQVHPLTDASLFKQFTLREGTTFEIRGEFFNVLNTVNFGGPTTSLTSSSFGVVGLTQANDPRIGQLTARFNF